MTNKLSVDNRGRDSSNPWELRDAKPHRWRQLLRRSCVCAGVHSHCCATATTPKHLSLEPTGSGTAAVRIRPATGC